MATRANSFPEFQRRLNQLRKYYPDNATFAQAVGVSRQTIGSYLNGARVPDCKTLQRISQKCGVSADWLLGLSKVKTSDATLQSAAEYSGLSEESLKQIKEWTSCTPTSGYVLDNLINCSDESDSKSLSEDLLLSLDRLFRYACRTSPDSKLSDLSNEDRNREYQMREEIKDLIASLPVKDIQLVTTEDFISSLKYTATCNFQKLMDSLISAALSHQSHESASGFIPTDEEILEEDFSILSAEENLGSPYVNDEYESLSEEEKKALDKRGEKFVEETKEVSECKKRSLEPEQDDE